MTAAAKRKPAAPPTPNEFTPIRRPRPLDEPVPPWDLHVTASAASEDTALCGEFVLDHCLPPQVIEIGRKRPNGSVITLDEIELEGGWLASIARHPEYGEVKEICRACLEEVEALRWPGRARRGRQDEKRKAERKAANAKQADVAKRAEDRFDEIVDETEGDYGDGDYGEDDE